MPNSKEAARLEGKRARTRALLIKAAAELAGEKGFHATTLENVAARVGMSRGAIYGNFTDREDLFLAVAEQRWEPIVPEFKPGATFRELMRSIGEAVAAAAPQRRKNALGALSFRIYALTHPVMQKRIAKQNAKIYRNMASGIAKLIAPAEMPMPPDHFIRLLHALTEGLLFTRFLTPNLITDEFIVAAFESLAPKAARRERR